jgi:hypothetical protein
VKTIGPESAPKSGPIWLKFDPLGADLNGLFIGDYTDFGQSAPIPHSLRMGVGDAAGRNCWI